MIHPVFESDESCFLDVMEELRFFILIFFTPSYFYSCILEMTYEDRIHKISDLIEQLF